MEVYLLQNSISNPKLNSNKPILCFKSEMHQTGAEGQKPVSGIMQPVKMQKGIPSGNRHNAKRHNANRHKIHMEDRNHGLARTMAYTTRNTVDRLTRKELNSNLVVLELPKEKETYTSSSRDISSIR